MSRQGVNFWQESVTHEQRERESAGGDVHLGKWLLPSVRVGKCGSGRAGWAHCSFTSLLWQRNENAIRSHGAHKYEWGCFFTHACVWQPQSKLLNHPAFKPRWDCVVIRLFAFAKSLLHNVCSQMWNEKSTRPLWVGQLPNLKHLRGENGHMETPRFTPKITNR